MKSRNRSAILSEGLHVLAFLSKEIEIYWKYPLPSRMCYCIGVLSVSLDGVGFVESSCFYACVRKTAEQLDESKCQEGALFEYVNTTAKVAVHACFE